MPFIWFHQLLTRNSLKSQKKIYCLSCRGKRISENCGKNPLKMDSWDSTTIWSTTQSMIFLPFPFFKNRFRVSTSIADFKSLFVPAIAALDPQQVLFERFLFLIPFWSQNCRRKSSSSKLNQEAIKIYSSVARFLNWLSFFAMPPWSRKIRQIFTSSRSIKNI